MVPLHATQDSKYLEVLIEVLSAQILIAAAVVDLIIALINGESGLRCATLPSRHMRE